MRLRLARPIRRESDERIESSVDNCLSDCPFRPTVSRTSVAAMSFRVRDVMRPQVVTVTPETTLAELADLLIRRRIGGAAVLRGGAVVGIVTRSDFARVISLDSSVQGLIGEGVWHEEFAPAEDAAAMPMPALAAALEGRTVRDAMTESPLSVSPETPLEEVARILVQRHLHHVLVVENGLLRGIVSALDIVRMVAERRLVES